MITPSSTVREVREAVSAWKDDNVVADAEITDAEDAEDARMKLNRNQKLLTKNQHNVIHQAHILQF